MRSDRFVCAFVREEENSRFRPHFRADHEMGEIWNGTESFPIFSNPVIVDATPRCTKSALTRWSTCCLELATSQHQAHY